MISIVQISQTSQRRAFFEKHKPEIAQGQTTWIVSDLRSKFEIQRELLDFQGWYQDECSLRASELWQRLLRRSRPELRGISKDFFLTWLKEQLSQENLPVARSAQNTVAQMMEMMAPVLAQEGGSEALKEWMQDHPEAVYRWGGWYALAQKYFSQLLDKNLFVSSWASALLVSHSGWEKNWQNHLIFDLGSEMKRHEVELILRLSNECEITVIEPVINSSAISAWTHLLRPYEILKSHAGKKQIVMEFSDSEAISANINAIKVSGTLAEIKWATQKVRSWIESGVPLQNIAIVAADVEGYWPLLSEYLREEGVPFNKTLTTRLQSFPHLGPWMAHLRILGRRVSYRDLESAYYFENPQLKLRFEEFQALFSKLLDPEDLARSREIEKYFFQSEGVPQGLIDRYSFLGLALRHWRGDPRAWELETAVREILSVPADDGFFKLSWDSWVHWLKQIAARKEINLQPAVSEGIQISQLLAADSWQATHRIFLGVSEGQLRQRQQRLVDAPEVESIAQETGFVLEHPDQHSWGFELHWLLQAHLKGETFLVYPATSLESGPEAPHVEWLARAAHSTAITEPSLTRWDTLQGLSDKALLAQSRDWDQDELRLKSLGIAQDHGDQPRALLLRPSPAKISPSLVETYLDCPFVYAVDRVFGLLDRPSMDLEPDPRVKGQLLHLMLEKILTMPSGLESTAVELSEWIESLREPAGLQHLDETFWAVMKKRYLKIAQRFIVFEKEWRKKFPQTKTMALEKKFSWPLDEQTTLNGKIDRIDCGEAKNGKQPLVVIDYKTSNNHTGFGSWMKNNQLQLGFYILALESNWGSELLSAEEGKKGDSEVIGAVYYALKNMSRKTGMVLAGSDTLMDLPRTPVQPEQKQKFLDELQVVLKKTMASIRQGNFSAQPREIKLCKDCQWRVTCRAPHLQA